MLNITLAQMNSHIGNITANTQKIISLIKQAQTTQQANLIIFPELALSGYPPEDLLLREDFIQEIKHALQKITQCCQDIYVVLGYPHQTEQALFNAAAVIHNKKIVAHYYKQRLPNYSVFDEKRYFIAGNQACVIEIGAIKFGIVICEDLWEAKPIAQAKAAGAQIIISINASPFDYTKPQQRYEILQMRQKETELPIIYAHLVGGQDELVFDGGSFALNKDGNPITQADYFKETLVPLQLDHHANFIPQANNVLVAPSTEQLVYDALVLAVHDYINKNQFPGVLLGLSGGIDSALTLAIAVDALGADKVQAVMMPSRYTSEMSLDGAAAQAQMLNVDYSVIAIERPFAVFLDILRQEFSGLPPDTTEENIQARCRGILLMAISNKNGRLVLTTGNKSEMSVGYATLYGDMAGGFAVLKDVPKTMVYRLANYRNKRSAAIPTMVIERPPSAELRTDQIDEDSLPPYAILDEILQRYVEKDQSIATIIAAGFEPAMVKKVVALVKRNEYKRRQAAPGPRITARAYGRDRRYPITSGF